MSALDIIRSHGVPIGTVHEAAQYMGEQGEGPQADSVYIQRIKELTGLPSRDDNSDRLRKTYAYLVVGIIAAFDYSDKIDVGVLHSIAYNNADKMIQDHPWMFAKSEAEPKLDDDGQVKKKKGAGKILAQQVYDDQIKGKVVSRKDAIAILVEAGVSSPAGCSTYYAKLKKGEL